MPPSSSPTSRGTWRGPTGSCSCANRGRGAEGRGGSEDGSARSCGQVCPSPGSPAQAAGGRDRGHPGPAHRGRDRCGRGREDNPPDPDRPTPSSAGGGVQALVRWSGFSGAADQSPEGVVQRCRPARSAGSGAFTRSAPGPANIPPALLPDGSTSDREVQVPTDLLSAGAVRAFTVLDGADIRSAGLTGLVRVESGRAPGGPGQVALTATLAHQLGIGIGALLQVPGDSRRLRVVGIARDRYGPQDSTAYSLPAATADSVAAAIPTDTTNQWYLTADAPVTWNDVERLNRQGFIVISRSVVLHPPPASQVPYFSDTGGLPIGTTGSSSHASAQVTTAVIGGMVLLEVVLLAGPAFAVGARRRRRQSVLITERVGPDVTLSPSSPPMGWYWGPWRGGSWCRRGDSRRGRLGGRTAEVDQHGSGFGCHPPLGHLRPGVARSDHGLIAADPGARRFPLASRGGVEGTAGSRPAAATTGVVRRRGLDSRGPARRVRTQ